MELAFLHGLHDTVANPVLDAVLPVVTALGNKGIFWIVVGVALLITKKYRFWGAVLLGALVSVGLMGEFGLKHLIMRPRPFIQDPTISLIIPSPSGFSFPSGHTSCAFAAAMVLSCAPLKKMLKVLAWVIAAAIAFSRLYLLVHFPTDVLGGAIFGALVGVAAVAVGRAVARRRAGGLPG